MAISGSSVQCQEEGELHRHHLLSQVAGDIVHLCPGEQPQSSGMGCIRWSIRLQSISLGVCSDKTGQEYPDPSSGQARSTPGGSGPRFSRDS